MQQRMRTFYKTKLINCSKPCHEKLNTQLTFGNTAIAAAASVGSRHITNDFVGLRRTVCRRSNARYQENEREKHAFARWVFNKKPKYGQFKKLESGNPFTGKGAHFKRE